MAGDFDITLHESFARELHSFADLIRAWDKGGVDRMFKAMQRIGQRFKTEAQRRAPVDETHLRGSIQANTFDDGRQIVTEVGTNVKEYPIYVEFGTEYIAGGRVKALGDGVDITDAQAITIWKAKNFGSGAMKKDGSRQRGGIVNEKTGEVKAAVQKAIAKRLEKGSAGEQLPWLRPAFNAIKEWAIAQQAIAMAPPGSQGAGAA